MTEHRAPAYAPHTLPKKTGSASAGHAPVVMDLSVLDENQPHLGLADLDWPSQYDSYHPFSRQLIDSLTVTMRAQDPGADAGAVIRAKACDIVTDLALVARLAFDIANAKRDGRSLRYNTNTSPMLAFLEAGGDPARAPAPRIWHHPVDLRAKTRLRKAALRTRSHFQALRAGTDRIDVHNRNNIVNTFLEADSRLSVDWPVTSIDWRHSHDVPAMLAASVAEIGRTYTHVISFYIDDTALSKTLAALGHHLIAHHIAKCWADFQLYERHMIARPKGSLLLGGTPKHLGRLAGWLYRREGIEVIRCAHGGDRAFFCDYEWGLQEFPDCDTYYTHSAGERDALARRIEEGGTALVEPERAIAFQSLGSPHHQMLLRRSKTLRRKEKTGAVVYVAGGYLGEQLGDFPNRKPPDPLYLDWQIDLLSAIRSLGYHVTVKLHPAGIAREARYLSHYADTILEGTFDPLNVAADAFIFDFAGTAFFDALATDVPMVFADLGVRPFDQTVFNDLVSRCPIAPTLRDERGRFRVLREALRDTLGNAIAMDTCPAGFHDRYFGA